MDLQLPMQSVPITTNVVSLNPAQGQVYSIQHYVTNVFQWLPAGWWFSQGTPVSFTNKTDRHDITEILLKVALNTITLTLVCKVFYRCVIKQFKSKQILVIHTFLCYFRRKKQMWQFYSCQTKWSPGITIWCTENILRTAKGISTFKCLSEATIPWSTNMLR